MPRWLVTGAGGMLASDLLGQLTDLGHEVTACARRDLDISDLDAVLATVPGHDVVVNCAAYTRVDEAESHESSAFAVNALGPANLARACRARGARLVHVSTDYVFSGQADQPYAEDAPLDPRSAYGRSKAAGEWAVRANCPEALIVRTAWLYGAGGRNFAKTVIRLSSGPGPVRIVADQRGQPTWSADVARSIVQLVQDGAAAGTWHATDSGEATWHEFAREIVTLLGRDPDAVEPITTAEYPLPAPRPAYSVLGHDKWRRAGLTPPPDWRISLALALPDLLQTMPRS